MINYFIGVDGGASKTFIRIEDEAGVPLAEGRSGPASIRVSAEKAWQTINAAIDHMLQSLRINPADKQICMHAGMGLAGCEIEDQYQLFLNYPHRFNTLVVASDAEVACIGAHGGSDGAIIIAGTGVVGLQIELKQITKVGGWGFPFDDEGGGAWLGMMAVGTTLQWLDGRLPISALAKTVYVYFEEDLRQLINFANAANSTMFAELAPLVIQCAKESDPKAISLLQHAAIELNRIGQALQAKQTKAEPPLPLALVGGIADFLKPYLEPALQARLTPCLLPPEAGAIFLVRESLKKRQYGS